MKRLISAALIFVFLFLCLPLSAFAEGEDTADVGIYEIYGALADKLPSDTVYYKGVSIENVGEEYLSLGIKESGAYISFECDFEKSGVLSNTIRMLIDNPTSNGVLKIEIEYIENGEKRIAHEELEIYSNKSSKIYYLDFENAYSMTKITISFPRISTADMKIYSITREYVYEDASEYIYEENNNVKAKYNSDTKTVIIEGNIGHTTVSKYGGAQLELHRLNVDSDSDFALRSASAPIATAPISMQFHFDVKVGSVSEIYSQYVVVVCDAEGEKHLLTTPCIPSDIAIVQQELKGNSSFKGIGSNVVIDVIDANPSLVVCDIRLDKLESKGANGYYALVNDKGYYFDREYVNTLDEQIKAYSDTNCNVYIRISLGELAQESQNDLWDKAYAFVRYITNRYNGTDHGSFDGIIVEGTPADEFSPDSRRSVNEYVRFYSIYINVIDQAARLSSPDVKIFLPISDSSNAGYRSESLLLSMSSVMDKIYSSVPSLSIALCGNNGAHGDEYGPDNIKSFELMLGCVAEKSELINGRYTYLWSVPDSLSGSALTAAYAYNYIRLFFESSAESFVVLFDEGNDLLDLKHIIKYIDTPRFDEVSSAALQMIGADSWSDIAPSFDKSKLEKIKLFERDPIDLAAVNVKGSYDLWKFAEENGVGGWYAINGANSVSLNVSTQFGRCLVAKMYPHDEIEGECSGIIYSYEEPKDATFVDYITYTFGISCESTAIESFEVKLIVGSSKEIIETTKIVKSGALGDLTVDIESLEEISYIQINVKPISNQTSAYSLFLNKVAEQSKKYSSEELAELERKEDSAGEENDGNGLFSDSPITVTVIILMCAALVVVAVITLVIHKKVDKNETDG